MSAMRRKIFVEKKKQQLQKGLKSPKEFKISDITITLWLKKDYKWKKRKVDERYLTTFCSPSQILLANLKELGKVLLSV